MSPEVGTLLGEIGVDIEHATVIVSHYTESIMLHHMSDPSRLDPTANFVIGNRIVIERACNLEKRNSAAIENVRDFWHRTSLTIGQPLTGHFRPVPKTVKSFIVDRCRRREVENNYRNLRPPDYRKHS